MAEVFSYRIKAQPSGKVNFRTLVAQFGDGYSQAVGDGINTRVQSWSISVMGNLNPDACEADKGDYEAVKAFLDARGGWQSFLWTPPGEAQGFYRCTSYSPVQNAPNIWTLSATFNQVFNP